VETWWNNVVEDKWWKKKWNPFFNIPPGEKF